MTRGNDSRAMEPQAESVDTLSTISSMLERKQAALRALTLRIETRRGKRPVAAEDAATLAILQHEVASLERSRRCSSTHSPG